MNLGWATAWRGTLAGLVLGGGGLALCVVAVVGLRTWREPRQNSV